MFGFLYRRIINNKWLYACLLIGAVAACAIFSSIPMYSNAILQKILTKDLEEYHIARKSSPASYTVTYNHFSRVSISIDSFGEIVENQLAPAFSLPVASMVKKVEGISKKIKNESGASRNGNIYSDLVSYSELDQHIKILHGRLPQKSPVDGVYEVMATEGAMKRLELLLDNTYGIYESQYYSEKEELLFKVKVVGIFTMKEQDDLYWSQVKHQELEGSIVFDEKVLLQIMKDNEEVSIRKLEWSYNFDYYSIKVQDIDHILNTFKQHVNWADRNNNIASITTPLYELFKNYGEKESQLRITLWILTVPLMIIICFYLQLIAGLIVKNDQNEIAVLKSRGAGTFQVFSMYVFQSFLMAFVSFICGPPLALFICHVLGSSNGFIEFIGRKALNPEITFETIAYSFAGAAFFIVFMLMPAFNACRVSIVQYKKSRLNSDTKPFWQRLYLDVLVMGFSAYGLYSFQTRQEFLGMSGLGGTDINVDPLLYFISTFFILGVSLMLLRIYPLLIRIIFKIGESWWNPVTYFSLVNVGRAEKNSQFIMLFLMLSLAFGIMNANQARTINRNAEDKIMYEIGADVVIEPYNNLKHQSGDLYGMVDEMLGTSIGPYSSSPKVDYKEPPYMEFKKIEGIDSITKVVVNNNSFLSSRSSAVRNLKILGITPFEFGNTVWFRNDLLPYHMNEYLNIMTESPKAILLSSNIQKDFDIEVGSDVEIKIGDGYLQFFVLAFIDYFPSCNPYNQISGNIKNSFAIINNLYIEKKLPVQPYEIWIKKLPDTPDSVINSELESRNLRVERADFAQQEIIKRKNDPMLHGTNGILTMCFIITMLIAAIGFIIFWVLSLKERALKFGIFRAIGMPMNGITMIMVLEQVLVSGCSILAGVLVGSLGSKIFIPMLQMIYSSAQQVPPFKVVALQSDYLKVIAITLVMLVSALSVLYVLIRKIKVNQVLKLGED